MKTFLKTFIILFISTLIFSSPVFAKNENAQKSLVALGDSIPYGYNLGNTNNTTSRYAFPYLMGEEANLRVRNLSFPGWRTDHLLTVVRHEQKYRQAIRHADYITLNIGSNDLLLALSTAQRRSGGNLGLLMLYIQEELNKSPMLHNISSILEEIRLLTDAPIVLFNIYNPFQNNDPTQTIGDLVLPDVNYKISTFMLEQDNIVIADAYTSYFSKQSDYVRMNDIHPTIAGQLVLAEIGLDALKIK